jgi:hypothetical protein
VPGAARLGLRPQLRRARPAVGALDARRARHGLRARDGAFIRDTGLAIRRALDSEDHDRRRRAELDAYASTRRKVFDELGATARELGFRVDIAPGRVTSTPMVEGEPITEERFDAMSDEARADLAQRTEQFELPLGAAVRRLRQIEIEEDERRLVFDRDAAKGIIDPMLVELRGRYTDQPELLSTSPGWAPTHRAGLVLRDPGSPVEAGDGDDDDAATTRAGACRRDLRRPAPATRATGSTCSSTTAGRAARPWSSSATPRPRTSPGAWTTA